jgi:hypothetical protein
MWVWIRELCWGEVERGSLLDGCPWQPRAEQTRLVVEGSSDGGGYRNWGPTGASVEWVGERCSPGSKTYARKHAFLHRGSF